MSHTSRFAVTALITAAFLPACAVGVENENQDSVVAVHDEAPLPVAAPGAGQDTAEPSARSDGNPVYFGKNSNLSDNADVDAPAPSYTFELVADSHMTIELARRNEDGPATIGFTLHRATDDESYSELGKVYGHYGTAAMSLYTVHGGTYAIRLLDGLRPETLVLTLQCNSGTCATTLQPGEVCNVSGQGTPCDKGLACVYEEGVCGTTDAPARCRIAPPDCPKTYEPVCGCGGETWGNECFAKQSGASVLHRGECKAD